MAGPNRCSAKFFKFFKVTIMPKTIHIRNIKLCPVIGFGFWLDDYSESVGYGSYIYTIILPFLKIQIGKLHYLDYFSNNNPETAN